MRRVVLVIIMIAIGLIIFHSCSQGGMKENIQSTSKAQQEFLDARFGL